MYPNYIWVKKGPHICGLNISDNTWICIINGAKSVQEYLGSFMWRVIKYNLPYIDKDNMNYLTNNLAMFDDSYIISTEIRDLS